MATEPSKIAISVASTATTASTAKAPVSTSQNKNDILDNKKVAETKTKQESLVSAESEKNIKTSSDKLTVPNLKTSAFSFNFTRLGPDLTQKLGDYQNNAQLATFCNIVRYSHDKCQSDLKDRKRVTEELLPHVFNANPEGIKNFINNKGPATAAAPASATNSFPAPALHPKLLLTKSSYRRVHFNKKLKQVDCFDHFKGVSALQAAYLCGDGPFIGRQILTYIIKDNFLDDKAKRLLVNNARQQLQELIDRIKPKRTAVNVMGISAVSKNTKDEYVDSCEFLAPVKELIKAYNTYIEQYNIFDSKGNITKDNWTVLDSLWEEVGECQKRLPLYVLQEFCGPTPFSPLTESSFTTPPPRTECLDGNNNPLDVDSFGAGTSFALYKARGCGAFGGWGGLGMCHADVDLAAMNRLCELREADLKHTVNCLATFEEAFEFITDGKAPKIEF